MSDALEAIEATAQRAAAANPREAAMIATLMRSIAATLQPYISQAIDERVAAERANMTRELTVLRAEIAELRSKGGSGLDYRGVWSPGVSYPCGTAATWEGSLFISREPTDRKPGTDNSGWQLAVKRGRDGRDAPSLKSRSGTATPRETP